MATTLVLLTTVMAIALTVIALTLSALFAVGLWLRASRWIRFVNEDRAEHSRRLESLERLTSGVASDVADLKAAADRVQAEADGAARALRTYERNARHLSQAGAEAK